MSVYRASLQGLRDANEDHDVVFLNTNESDPSYNAAFGKVNLFCVFDGHGGSSVSTMLKKRLPKMLLSKKISYPLTSDNINQIFDSVQTDLVNDPNKVADHCGSTALCIIYYKKMDEAFLQIINSGDCRAVVCCNNLAIPLTKDHKPYWYDERQRIEYINSTSQFKDKIYYDGADWRIKDMSVSRALGDVDSVPYVTHIPDIFYYALTDQDRFLVLACDGLWDVLCNQDVVNFVLDHLQGQFTGMYETKDKDGTIIYPPSEFKEPDNIAEKLAYYAIAKGSCDNVSVVVVVFKN
jgi:serine/threonine protein phosphatase PrpC